MFRRLLTLAVLALAVATFGVVEPAWACSCVSYDSPEDHLAQVDVVFVGKVVKSRRLGAAGDGIPEMVTTFTNVRVWKGAATRRLELRHAQAVCCVCGLSFTRGQTVTVFAHRGRDGRLSSSSCSSPRFEWAEYERVLRRQKAA